MYSRTEYAKNLFFIYRESGTCVKTSLYLNVITLKCQATILCYTKFIEVHKQFIIGNMQLLTQYHKHIFVVFTMNIL